MMNLSVTMIMFTVYVTILLKLVSSNVKLIKIMIGSRIAFGMLSYALITALNSIEVYIMNTRGLLHVLLIGPVQEETAKFAFFLLAYIFITCRVHLNNEELSELRGVKNLVVLGASIGLTLAVFENLIDYSYLTIELTLIRTIVCWPLHIITIGLLAYGFNRYIITSRRIMILSFLLLAFLIHIFYNVITTIVPF